jgi:SAM-dependent methyltransferase
MVDSSADPKQRFSSRVANYVAARPTYPPEVVPHLHGVIGLTKDWIIADLGSGTGISCVPFLGNGNAVIGVEPNAAMRSAAEESLRAFAKFRSVDGSAEATTLPDASVDLIVAAQAFHWFDIDNTRRECLRILKPGGWALLMWNNRQLGGSPFLEAYEQLLVDFGTDYLKVRHNNVSEAQLTAFFGGGYQGAKFPNHQHLDFAGLQARLLSSSYVPQDGHPRYGPMVARLRDLFDQYNAGGRVTIEYRTELFYARMR